MARRWAAPPAGYHRRAPGRIIEDVERATERLRSANKSVLREAVAEALGGRARLRIRSLDPEGSRYAIVGKLRIVVPPSTQDRVEGGVAGERYVAEGTERDFVMPLAA